MKRFIWYLTENFVYTRYELVLYKTTEVYLYCWQRHISTYYRYIPAKRY